MHTRARSGAGLPLTTSPFPGGSLSISRTLPYGKKKTIRVIINDRGVWLAAYDLYAAAHRYTDRGQLSHFSPDHLALLEFPSDAGPLKLTAVSPLGALTVAASLPMPVGRILEAWVRREVNLLCREFGYSPLVLSLLADNTMPIRPRVLHEDYAAWHELNNRYPRGPRFPANLQEPALFDEDPGLGAYDPERGKAVIESLMAAGEAAILADASSRPQDSSAAL